MKTFPFSISPTAQLEDDSVTTEKLSTQAKDKHLTIDAFDLDAAMAWGAVFDKNIIIDAILSTVVDGALAESSDVVLSLSNGAIGSAKVISTVTIDKTAADLEVDNGTTPDATHKHLVAGTVLQLTASTPAAASKHATIIIIFHEEE